MRSLSTFEVTLANNSHRLAFMRGMGSYGSYRTLVLMEEARNIVLNGSVGNDIEKRTSKKSVVFGFFLSPQNSITCGTVLQHKKKEN